MQPFMMASIDPSAFGGVLSGCLHSITGMIVVTKCARVILNAHLFCF